MPGAPAGRRASRRRDLLVQPTQRGRRRGGAVLLGAVRLGDRAEPHWGLDGVARRPTVRGAQQHRGPNSGRLRVAVARGDHGRRPPCLGGCGEAARRDDPPGRHRARGLGPLRVDPRPARRAAAGRRTRAAARRDVGLQRLALGGALDARHGGGGGLLQASHRLRARGRRGRRRDLQRVAIVGQA